MGIDTAKPMELRKRIERALMPMVEELRVLLTRYPTILVLNYYLGKAHAARMYENRNARWVLVEVSAISGPSSWGFRGSHTMGSIRMISTFP